MALHTATPQTNEGVFPAPIPRKTANAPDKKCRSHVTSTVSAALCKEPPGKATLACHPAHERTKLTLLPHSLGMGNSALPRSGGAFLNGFHASHVLLPVTRVARPGSPLALELW